ncbi:MAG: ribosome biogenesis GTPase Der [Bacteroidetes bacterium GWC2_33_15]|nr:MAG: ribosome biogenesis GTPase Der [Bacteroidetes bacterium GWA2_33_15]OFX50194.1 MAG: ribosome biogenesis GTPase Der [Bacteroidetes bacterium GWC2_33_15]OFX65346.1 MAG: ribosome biogenesis GTPase Der [Bacteroidetes bacterium GWB2_32_14]OFX70573.1 MAG: ribosome biogenesis GTPase Der [Bacteroidetes bacterium GWD2_33_33]HAN19553.1 ribosome biogenesis GTPase Der [Bacteroidales bacterium]
MILAIVGRPNVGKSTLFNRLTGTKHAIVDETSGVTRDRLYGKAEWSGREFSVIDTGGYVRNSDDIFEEEIRKQVDIAIEEAHVVLFVVDVTSGVTDLDNSVAEILRKSKKKVILAVNKVDNNARIIESHEFYKFGLGEPFCISSINGSGTGELLDEVIKYVETDLPAELEIPKFAVVGRPNVGKSSLVNALLGEERNIVTPISGTTRDSIYTRYNKYGHDFYLVDTAGLRKKGKVNEDLEFFSVMRSIRAIENADVCLLMLDAAQGLEAQDMNIIKVILKNNKGLVVLVNKWDLYEKDTNTSKHYIEQIKQKIAPFVDIPIIFTSTVTKQRINKVLEEAMRVHENRQRRISTAKLNDIMLEVIASYPPPAVKGKYVKVKYVTQLNTHYPSFVFFCNLPQYVTDAYKRYLENKLRDKFDFTGTPIQIYMRKK